MPPRPAGATLGRMNEPAPQLTLVAAILLIGIVVYGTFAALAITFG